MAPKLYIVYYSTWGHIAKLADAIEAGAKKVGGVEVTKWQVAETLPDEVLAKMYASPKNKDIPIITPAELAKADGVLFGIPTRYGNMPAQWKTFWDSTGAQWGSGGYYGKLAGTFFSSGTQHGGQEVTALNTLSTFAHHGFIYVPLGFARTPHLQDNSEIIGGSPWGSGTIVGGDGSRQPSVKELEIAEIQGCEFAKVLLKHA